MTMKSMSNEPSSSKRQRTRSPKRVTNVNLGFLDLPQDTVLIVFRCISFPELCRIKTVCKFWMQPIDTAIVIRLGEKQFVTNTELVAAVRDYCRYKRSTGLEKVAGDASLDKLATTYGWPIGKWDVSQVTNFTCVFEYQRDFNEYIGDWDVSNGTEFRLMFHGASSFDQDIGDWNISKATSFCRMFQGASSFNRDLTNWTTLNAENMSCMFQRASKFNGDVSNFHTSKVIDMAFMFHGASDFNRDISKWSTSRVSNMNGMFAGASNFNQDISCWDTSHACIMYRMFFGATSFCQNISTWDVTGLDEGYHYEDVFDGAMSFRRDYSPRFEAPLQRRRNILLP